MLTLLSTSDAAQKLGISVQGVHYRIKTNKLKSVFKDGKIFVYVDFEEQSKETASPQNNVNSEIIKAKDEQIGFLKKAIRWLGFQHKSEIKRLEQNHDRLIEVFKSEVELLQKAYNEMQNLYKMQNKIPQSVSNPTQNQSNDNHQTTITIEDFFLLMRRRDKTYSQIKRIILHQIEIGDDRFFYDANNKRIIIKNDKYYDL